MNVKTGFSFSEFTNRIYLTALLDCRQAIVYLTSQLVRSAFDGGERALATGIS